MRITSKGQVTIPQAVREKAGLHPFSEVTFQVLDNGDVVIRPATGKTSPLRAALERVRGSANATQFMHMDTDAFMRFLRG